MILGPSLLPTHMVFGLFRRNWSFGLDLTLTSKITVAVMKHHDQKQLREERVYFVQSLIE